MSTLDTFVRVVDALALPFDARGNGVWRVATAREAWEILAERGVIPNDAPDDPRRGCVCWCGIRREDACQCRGRGVCPHPAAIADVVTLAARWSAVLATEELARVVALRLAPWGVAPVARVTWRVGERDTGMPAGWHRNANDHAGDGDESWDARWQLLHGAGEPYPWWRGHAELWSERDARAGQCPHEPYLAILRLGFAIDRIGDGEATLVCPRMIFDE